MLESELLRQEISLKFNINLEKYKWSKELAERIFNIEFDWRDEDKVSKMLEVYENGLNIGACGRTARYLAIEFPDAELHIGICDLLVGTKNAEFGNHAWITIEDKIIDSTLMIQAPIKELERYYHTNKVLDYNSARVIPEYCTYSDELKSKSRK